MTPRLENAQTVFDWDCELKSAILARASHAIDSKSGSSYYMNFAKAQAVFASSCES